MIYNRGGNREFGKITKKTLTYLSYLSSNNYVVLASQYRGNDGEWRQEEFGGKDIPDGHLKIPHLWPLQNTPPTSLFHPLKRD